MVRHLTLDNQLEGYRIAGGAATALIYVNNKPADSGTPFGWYRQSGNGREGGSWGLHEYLEVKTKTEWN